MTDNRKMPKKLDFGSYVSSTLSMPLLQYEEWKNKDIKSSGYRMVMGFKLPSWQRSFVWTEDQSIKLIESIWLGVNIGTYTFNRSYNQDQYDDLLIDGQQRMKAIENYINNQFRVFDYFWSELDGVDKRSFSNCHFHSFITSKDDEEYLRNYYNLLNFSGTSHKEEERA